MSALGHQEGGSHYVSMAIQPVEFIHKNGIGFIEGSVIKYVCRHRSKGKAKDIKKAIHFLQLLLEMEYGDQGAKGTRTEMPGDGGNAGATSQPMRPHPNYGR